MIPPPPSSPRINFQFSLEVNAEQQVSFRRRALGTALGKGKEGERPKGGSAYNIPNSQHLNPRAIDPAALKRRPSVAFVSRAHNTSSKDVYVLRKEDKLCRLSGRAMALHHIWLGRWRGLWVKGAATAPGRSGWSDTEGLNMVQPERSLRAGLFKP